MDFCPRLETMKAIRLWQGETPSSPDIHRAKEIPGFDRVSPYLGIHGKHFAFLRVISFARRYGRPSALPPCPSLLRSTGRQLASTLITSATAEQSRKAKRRAVA